MHYEDDMTGFLSDLKGGAAPTAAAAPPHPVLGISNPPAAAAGVHNPSPALRNHRTPLNGLTPSFPAFSSALSSSAGGGGGVVARTLSVLRGATGEASLGSFNNGVAALHPMPPSLSADPPLQSQPIPQRSPPSPIPHLGHSAFATNTFHPYGALTHFNQSPSSVARQALNYSPQPPNNAVSAPPQSNPGSQQPQHVPQSNPISNVPTNGVASQQRLSATQQSHPQPAQQQSQQLQVHAPPHPQPHPSSQELAQVGDQRQPVSQPQLSDTRHPSLQRSSDLHTTTAQHYPGFAAPQPQVMSTVYRGHPSDSSGMMQTVATRQQPVPRTQAVPAAATGSATQAQKRSSSGTPAKRARTNSDRPSQSSPTGARSGAGTASNSGGGIYWEQATGNSNKSRSGNTGPANAEAGTNGLASSGPTEEQSRPERKREREKRRRETMNTRFNELAACLVISAGGKSDKESILAEAVDHVKKQAGTIKELEKQNRDLMSEAHDLRAEKTELRQDKNYLREERDRLKAEVESLKAELRRKKKARTENGVKEENTTGGHGKREEEAQSVAVKAEVKV